MARTLRATAFGAAFALALAVAPGVAFAQNGDNETIVVTATKRESSIQDVPFSVNAQTQEDIQRSGSTNLEDISRNVAGMSIQNLGPGQSQVSLRGVSAGQIVRDQPGVKEQVGVYLDESVISLSLFTPDLDLYDLNRVETLRGPQGTLFGSGSVGGTIRYITNAPELGIYSGSIEASVNTVEDGEEGGALRGMLNMPLGNQAALRIVGYHTEYGGFIDALREGGGVDEDVNSGSRTGVRIAMTVQPNDALTITPRAMYQIVENDGFNRQEVFNLFANPYTTTRPAIQLGERQQYLLLNEEFSDEFFLGDLTVTYDFGAVELTSISTYINRSILVSRDASALTGSVSVSPLGGAGFPESSALLPSNLRDTTDYQQFTQEVRLASNTDSRFQWLVGAFYSDVERNYEQRLPTPGYDAVTDTALGAGTAAGADNGFGLVDNPYHADLPYDYTQWALFGEASYALTDRLTVTAGARYYDFEEDRRFHSGGLFSNADDQLDSTASDGVSPRVLLRYEWDNNLSFNAQVSKGFRLGGANDPLNIPLCSGDDALNFGGFPTYEDETLWNYEVGSKYDNGRMTLNVAAYYTDITDLQVTADAGSCSSRVIFNADAHTAGIEAEFATRITDGLEFSLAGSWIEAEFDETRDAVGGGVLAGIRDGNRLPSVPEYQVAATLAYYFPVNWGAGLEGFVSASAQHLGSRYTQPGDQEPGAGMFVSNLPFAGATGLELTEVDLELDPYTIVNFNAGVEGENWGLTLFVNNAFDENANLAFDRERGGRARLGFHTTQPRTVGVTLRRSF
jgi:iron complex outermembrane receptor protein